MASSKYTILSVAKTVAEDREEHGTHKLASYIQWAKKGYRRLNEDTLQQVRTTKLAMNAYNAVDLDEIDDFVDWTKVGVQYGDKVFAMGQEDDIALYHNETDCGVLEKNPHRASYDDHINGTNLDPYMPNYFYGYYGLDVPPGLDANNCFQTSYGPPYKGYFRVNKERNQLQFSSNVNVTEVYIEYISDGTCCDGATKIDSRCFDYLVLFTHYESIRNRRDVPIAEKQRMEGELFYELNRLKKIINPITKEDLVNAVRKGYRMDPHI
jgi:hypothetical protein